MKIIILVLLLAFMNIGGCGGSDSDGGCDFDLEGITNGPNAQEANSIWECIDQFFELFDFQVFEDGTGFSSDIGPFTFQQSGCRSVDFQSAFGDAEAVNIQGSTDSGVLTFRQVSSVPELDDLNVGCILILL